MSGSTDELLVGQLVRGLNLHGDRPALVSAGRTLTYNDLSGECNRLANGLLGLGLTAGDHFAFLLPNGCRILSCYLACATSGIVGVPLAARMTEHDLVHQLQDSGAVTLLYAHEWAATVSAISERLPDVRHFVCDEELDGALAYADLVCHASVETPGTSLAGDDPFCVMYTGGTTGASKAAVQTQRAWAACLLDTVDQLGLTPDDRHAVVLPMTHAAWFTVGAHLRVGATTHVLERWHPDALLELVERERLTVLHMIPTLLGDLLTAIGGRKRDLSSVRLLTVAGSPLPLDMYHRARDVFGDIIGNIYGLTEAAGPVTYLLPRDMDDERLRSGGRAGRYVEIKIFEEPGQAIEGMPLGEIALRGPQVTPGYLNRPQETAAAFRDGWFCTGDIGYLDADEFLYILDRKKDMIKSGGFNVYPKEVEEVLYLCDDVLEAAVIGIPDPKWMEAVVAVVVARDGADCDGDALISHCRSHLAGYKVPKTIHLAATLPRTGFGKFDKKALQQRYAPRAAAPTTQTMWSASLFFTDRVRREP